MQGGRVALVHIMPSEKYETLKKLTENLQIRFDFPYDGDEYKIGEE